MKCILYNSKKRQQKKDKKKIEYLIASIFVLMHPRTVQITTKPQPPDEQEIKTFHFNVLRTYSSGKFKNIFL